MRGKNKLFKEKKLQRMKSDMEILHEYVDEYNRDFYESLFTPEQILYLCQLRDTLPFILYLLRYRILEFVSRLVKSMRKIKQKGISIGNQNYGNHEVLVSVATEKKIDEGCGYYQVDINTICQCTGIPDKTREKLIFEHDILEGHLDEEHPEDITRVTVRWRKNKWLTIQEGAIENEELDDFCTEHYRIIGNELDMHN